MDKTEQCLLQKLIMNLKKKVNKEEANHKQQIKLKIKMMKRKNLFQEANPNLKNQKLSHRWSIEEKFKKTHQK
jgi:hypothetical protein